MWTSATLLDLFGGRKSRHASERLIAVGTLRSGAHGDHGVERLGRHHAGRRHRAPHRAVHAISNVAALCPTGRRSRRAAEAGGERGAPRLTGLGPCRLAATSAVTSRTTRWYVQQTAFRDMPADWTRTVPEGEVHEGEAVQSRAGDIDVMLTRHQDGSTRLRNRCTHRGGSLADGTLRGRLRGLALHASVFRLSDGAVMRGAGRRSRARVRRAGAGRHGGGAGALAGVGRLGREARLRTLTRAGATSRAEPPSRYRAAQGSIWVAAPRGSRTCPCRRRPSRRCPRSAGSCPW